MGVRFSRVAVDLSNTVENERAVLFDSVASVILSVFIAHFLNNISTQYKLENRHAFYLLVHKNHWCAIDIS